MKNKRLSRLFYEQPTLTVAKQLLGKYIIFKNKEGKITETEAYIGENDPACHARKGKTPRNKVMYGKAGITYVYIIYGMYYCLNFVTEKIGFPAAVLIRGVEGISGPGKLCRYFKITKKYNSIDLCACDFFYVEDRKEKTKSIRTTSRIGIKEGTEKLWRFII